MKSTEPICGAMLYRVIFAPTDDPEWWAFVNENVPAKCLPTSRGDPWKALVSTYGLDTLRDMFQHGDWEGSEGSYHAEVKFDAWCKRKGYDWTFVSTDW